MTLRIRASALIVLGAMGAICDDRVPFDRKTALRLHLSNSSGVGSAGVAVASVKAVASKADPVPKHARSDRELWIPGGQQYSVGIKVNGEVWGPSSGGASASQRGDAISAVMFEARDLVALDSAEFEFVIDGSSRSRDFYFDLSSLYAPGVAEVCRYSTSKDLRRRVSGECQSMTVKLLRSRGTGKNVAILPSRGGR